MEVKVPWTNSKESPFKILFFLQQSWWDDLILRKHILDSWCMFFVDDNDIIVEDENKG